jgi:hypothetical protein
MILREFIYFNQDHADPQENNRYISNNDTGILKKSDLRKTRLTLRMINDIRKASETHNAERKKDLGLVRKMYAMPAPADAAAGGAPMM